MSGRYFNHSPTSQEWYTPPELLAAIPMQFDLDPAHPGGDYPRWARWIYTPADDGLLQVWHGEIWLNPPYHRATINHWMRRMSAHRRGIALVYARTDTAWWHLNPGQLYLFIKGRLHFNGDHRRRAPAPSVLIAYGDRAVEALGASTVPGQLMRP